MSKKKRKTGLSPGTLIYTGKSNIENQDVTVIQYNENTLNESFLRDHDYPIPSSDKITWYDIRGLSDVQLIEKIGKAFHIHPLALEDIVDVSQRPKLDEYDDGIFMIIRGMTFDDKNFEIKTEQVSIYFNQHAVLTFQEDVDDLYESVRNRLKNQHNGRIRKRGTDYLVYALLDTLVDNYYLVLDKLEESIYHVENNILAKPSEQDKAKIHDLKSKMLVFRKNIVPLREAISRFLKLDSKFVSNENEIFIRDVYDHINQIIDSVETYRDMLNNLYELYISQISLKMNNVMKVLTVISAIFIPLTFLAGVYGMNFDNMPELHYQNGYFVLMTFMIILALLLMLFFKRKEWM